MAGTVRRRCVSRCAAAELPQRAPRTAAAAATSIAEACVAGGRDDPAKGPAQPTACEAAAAASSRRRSLAAGWGVRAVGPRAHETPASHCCGTGLGHPRRRRALVTMLGLVRWRGLPASRCRRRRSSSHRRRLGGRAKRAALRRPAKRAEAAERDPASAAIAAGRAAAAAVCAAEGGRAAAAAGTAAAAAMPAAPGQPPAAAAAAAGGSGTGAGGAAAEEGQQAAAAGRLGGRLEISGERPRRSVLRWHNAWRLELSSTLVRSSE